MSYNRNKKFRLPPTVALKDGGIAVVIGNAVLVVVVGGSGGGGGCEGGFGQNAKNRHFTNIRKLV